MMPRDRFQVDHNKEPWFPETNDQTENFRKNPASIDGGGVYDALRPIFTVTMLLGVTPLTNIRTSTSQHLKFNWCRPQTIYSGAVFFSLLFGVYITATSYTYLFMIPLEINDVALSLSGPVFYVSNTLSVVQCILVTRKLPELFRHWDEVTFKLKKYLPGGHGNVHIGKTTAVMVASVLGISSVIEHALHDLDLPILLCPNYTNFFQCYYTRGNAYFNDIFGHSIPLSIYFWIIQKYANVAWHFHDIFLVILAMALRANFKVMADYIKRKHMIIVSPKTWREIREDHLDLIDLTERLDKVISLMILQSYAVNLFYLCFQISLSIRPMQRTWVQMIYFCYSLLHLTVRMSAVTAAAASIQEQAVAPLPYLFECPSVSYCTEIYRFTNHLMSLPIGLTGFQFFVVTRRIFLAVISVLITYELILLKVT